MRRPSLNLLQRRAREQENIFSEVVSAKSTRDDDWCNGKLAAGDDGRMGVYELLPQWRTLATHTTRNYGKKE